MAFFTSAISTLQTLVVALGAGLGVWGAINLLEVIILAPRPMYINEADALKCVRQPPRHSKLYDKNTPADCNSPGCFRRKVILSGTNEAYCLRFSPASA